MGNRGSGTFAHDKGLLTGGGVAGLKLFIVQLVIAAVAVVFAGFISVILAYLLKITLGWRVDPEVENAGIDYAVHGETAYETVNTGWG